MKSSLDSICFLLSSLPDFKSKYLPPAELSAIYTEDHLYWKSKRSQWGGEKNQRGVSETARAVKEESLRQWKGFMDIIWLRLAAYGFKLALLLFDAWEIISVIWILCADFIFDRFQGKINSKNQKLKLKTPLQDIKTE